MGTIVETDGDRRAPDTAWGEGVFVAALEDALLDGRVDLAVHSAKDVPTEMDDRLRIGAYLSRADPRDALSMYNRGVAKQKMGNQLAGDIDVALARGMDPNVGK